MWSEESSRTDTTKGQMNTAPSIRRHQHQVRSRRGFSLAEILVALAIMATLAAVLIPAVNGQIARSDATRTIQDLTAIRTGVEQFIADVHRYPGKVSHLGNPITAAQMDVNNSLYPTGLVARWKGPYLGRDTLPGGYQTGFGAVVRDSLVKLTFQPSVNYATVILTGITQPNFDRMDIEIDGVAGATTGMLRWFTGAGSGIDTVKFLIIPIQ
jgi:prepilin-type N-terminal cleavage/methylation domain-containing protein